MRSNLLSLKNIATQMNRTQNILSTGKKVNSAIDNASSYYQARSLTNRANDLNSLLDSMSQGIQTIQAATKGLESATSYLTQAKAFAEQTSQNIAIPEKDWFAKQEGVVAVVSTWDELKTAVNSGQAGEIVVYGQIDCKETITLKKDQSLVGIGKYGIPQPDKDKFSQLTFNDVTTRGISIQTTGVTLSDLSIKFTSNSHAYTISGKSGVEYNAHNMDIFLETKLDKQVSAYYYGTINMTGTNSIYQMGEENHWSGAPYALNALTCNLRGNLNINLISPASMGIVNSNFNSYGNSEVNIKSIRQIFAPNNKVSFNDNSKVNLSTPGIVFSQNNVVDINDNTELNVTNGIFLYGYANTFVNINSLSSNVNIKTTTMFNGGGSTLNMKQGCTYALNGNLYKAETDVSDNTMIKNNPPAGVVKVDGVKVDLPKTLDWLLEEDENRTFGYDYVSLNLEQEKQYSNILTQFDNLLIDSSYQGVNLLTGGNLDVTFNETRTHELSVKGKDMRSDKIGLKTRKWNIKDDVDESIKEITEAMNKIRNYSAELGNNYAIIQTRQNFTDALCSVLQTGADNLVLADMNEASAEYLMLQTRQQLAINSLSLASQSAQSILSLF